MQNEGLPHISVWFDSISHDSIHDLQNLPGA